MFFNHQRIKSTFSKRYFQKELYCILACFAVIILVLTGCGQKLDKKIQIPTADKGVIDLTKLNLQEVGNINLDGDWEFYWGQLLTPEDFKGEIMPKPDGFFKMPESWASYTINGSKLPGYGYATYRLKIKSNDKNLGLKISYILTAYKLWINRELVAGSGVVGKAKGEMVPFEMPKPAYYRSASNDLEIVLQISNFYHQTGGMRDSLIFGTYSNIEKSRNIEFGIELLILGSVLIMGLYHIGLFLLRRKNVSGLYFGIVCLIISIRTMTHGEIFLNILLPGLPWQIHNRIEYLTFLVTPFFLAFVRAVYVDETSKRFTKISFILWSLISAVILFTPIEIYSNVLIPMELIMLATGGYILFVMIVSVKHKREGSSIVLFGYLFLFATAINDVLYNNALINTGYMASLGVFIFIFSQSFILSMRFSNAFNSVEHLTSRLTDLNNELDKKVLDRTSELISSNEQLENALLILNKAQSQLVESEKMAAITRMVSGVAHELNTPLGVSVTAASHLVNETEAMLKSYNLGSMKRGEFEGYIKSTSEVGNMVLLNLHRAAEIIKSFKQVAVDQFAEEKRRFNVKEYINDIMVSLTPKIKKSKQRIEINCDDKIEIDSYPGCFYHIISNLIINSLIHAYDENDEGNIRIDIMLKKDKLFIIYSDDGRGIEKQNLDKIFEPFFTTKKGSGGSGLGLSIIYNIVNQKLGGSIKCESKIGKGTNFTIEIPAGE